MSNDVRDIEWRCGCGHTNPDYDERCNGCGQERYGKVIDLMEALKKSLKAEAASPAQTGLAAYTAARQDEPRRQVEDNPAPRI